MAFFQNKYVAKLPVIKMYVFVYYNIIPIMISYETFIASEKVLIVIALEFNFYSSKF